jgi:hypothetical protein
MSAAVIAQLLIAFGPPAIQMIQQLVALWNKPALTPDEVMAFCASSQKSFDDYMKQAQSKIGTP